MPLLSSPLPSLLTATALAVTGCGSPDSEAVDPSPGQSPQKAEAGARSPGPRPDHPQPGLRELIAAAKNREQLQNIPFRDVIEAVANRQILKLDSAEEPDRAILDAVSTAIEQVSLDMNSAESPVRGLRRINEASRFFEDALMENLQRMVGFSCSIPPTATGSAQRAGYPDLRLLHEASGTVAYLDPKLFEEGSEKSSLRTFYFEPRVETNKILENAHHLLLGIRHDGNDGNWRFLGWEIVDLYGFRVRLKPEFQGSNRDLYQEDLILSSGRLEP